MRADLSRVRYNLSERIQADHPSASVVFRHYAVLPNAHSSQAKQGASIHGDGPLLLLFGDFTKARHNSIMQQKKARPLGVCFLYWTHN